jgi:hypothetical protein
MAMACIPQVFDNASALQAAGRALRQDAFHIPGASLALCAEAALAPQYGLAHNTLSSIIGQLHFLILHERPQILPVFKGIAALTAQIAVKPCTGFKQRFASLIVKLTTYFANRAFGLAYHLKIPLQMRPAYLANQCVKFVNTIAITYQLARTS